MTTPLVGFVQGVVVGWRPRRPRRNAGTGVLGSGRWCASSGGARRAAAQWHSPLEAGVSSRGAGPSGESWATRGKQKRERRGGLRQIPAR
jgi:hypothetical protein